MFDYNIYPENNFEQFKNACTIVERNFPKAEKRELIIDVDGTTIQTYNIEDKNIDVIDDYDIGAVYIKSDLILDFLRDKKW